MSRHWIIIALFVAASAEPAAAQHRDTLQSDAGIGEDLEEALETFDTEETEAGPEQLTQFLQELAADPVNINRAGLTDLLQVPGINLKTAKAIVAYREDVKPFETAEELREVDGIGRVTLGRARPYITAGSGFERAKRLYTDPRYWTAGGRFEAFSRYRRDLQEARGYRVPPGDGGYIGSPVRYYQRFRYRSNHLSANLTQEKDAGEPLPGPAGFDYSSWHVALEDNGRLRTLVAGDYSLSFGQGLVLSDGGVFGKGSNVTGSANRGGRGIKPYTSAREDGFRRGLAATWGRTLKVTGFWSRRRVTATGVGGDTTRYPRSGGYHRTLREQSQKNNLRQELYGGRVAAELPFGIVGVTGYRTRFNRYIAASEGLHARYDFEGRSHSAAAVDYSLVTGPALLFGETARSANGGVGVVGGVAGSVAGKTEVTLLYRSYARDFQSPLGSGFGESSGGPQNEEGIYLGLQHEAGERVTVSGYFDQFRFPAPRFGTTQPTQGYDWLGRVEVEFPPGVELYLQVRDKIKEEEYEAENRYGRTGRRLGSARRSTVRGNAEYWIDPAVRLRTRGEIVRSRPADEQAEYGFLLYQDLRLIPADNLRLDARVAVFETGGFGSRVYQFENDLLYVFGSRALFDTGQRIYLLLHWQPFRFMDLWGKFGITIYEDRQTVGSGLNEIEGNRRSEVGFQARFRF